MERGSNKHGPLLDDRLRADAEPLERGGATAARVEEHRESEPSAPRTPDPSVPDEKLRSAIARSLHRVDYPADRDTLIAEARDNNAPGSVVEALGRLPDGTTFENAQEIWVALGGEPEERF